MRTTDVIGAVFAGLLIASFPISNFAYMQSSLALFSVYEGLASFLFWFSIVALTFLFPMRYIFFLFTKYIKSLRGVAIFSSYMAVHLILYGLILEGIISYAFKIQSTITQPAIYFNSVPVYPVSFVSILAGLGFNPAIDIYIPPVYVLALSFYIISLSFIIATLVLTNVSKVLEIGKACSTAFRSRSLVVLPALGVIGGAACCLSLPVLLALAAPTTAIIAGNPDVFYAAYFAFPVATAIGLKYNMDSTARIASKVSTIAMSKNSMGPKTGNASLTK